MMKILALTSIRSDYDLLSPLYKLLYKDQSIEFKLLVSGAHLSQDFGYTKQYIEKDGFDILLEVETLINSNTSKSRLKTASILLQNSIDVIDNFHPDVILFAGDREDVIIGGLLGTYLNLPTIHFYGGDHEEDGHQDTCIRHATSKLSSLHFVSTAEHKNRLLSMGESKDRIHNIGSISLDKFSSFNTVDLMSFFETDVPNKFALVIFHPLQNENNGEIFNNILQVLKQKNIFAIVSHPNTDPGYSEINQVIDTYSGNKNFLFYKNLERDVFLTVFSNCSFIIGNSSAGIYEAATIGKAAINVGLRQQGRMSSENVIFTEHSQVSITASIEYIDTDDFKSQLKKVVNPYGDGKSAVKAYNLIKKLDFTKFVIKYEDPLKEQKHE